MMQPLSGLKGPWMPEPFPHDATSVRGLLAVGEREIRGGFEREAAGTSYTHTTKDIDDVHGNRQDRGQADPGLR